MDSFFCLLIIFSISNFFSLQSLAVDAKINGFSIPLVHRDSPLSPFYNHSATIQRLSENDALRSIARANRFSSSSSLFENKIESRVIPNGGDYLMKISVGTPPVEGYATADTGSDLIWFQCAPCTQCYPQDNPVFDPSKSSTYNELSCNSRACQALPKSQCGGGNGCTYFYSYGDKSHTSGVLATDTMTLDSSHYTGTSASFPDSVFGCGHDNAGTFNSRGSGLVGLGGGPLSLVSQLSSQIEQKFAYCLLPRNAESASRLRFGTEAVIQGTDVVSTPLFSKDSTRTFYYLNLEAVTVGNTTIPFNNPASGAGQGNIIIDSGTTLTMLEQSFYNELESAVRDSISLQSVDDPRGNYKLCYDNKSLSSIQEMGMVFHFTGADVVLETMNIFRMVNDDLSCLAIIPADSLNIYGNVAQVNFQVGYDLASKRVSFAPADCTKY